MCAVFIIEHLEPKLWEWCIIEYRHINKIVGKNNLWFSNINKKYKRKLKKYGKVFTDSVKKLNLKNACILDLLAKKTLKCEEAKRFDYFIFGGILGDNPPKKRTYLELTKYFNRIKKRNLGKEQLSTDNAVFVANEILKGKELENIKFLSSLEIKINKRESTILPYKYPLKNGKPNISTGLIRYLKRH